VLSAEQAFACTAWETVLDGTALVSSPPVSRVFPINRAIARTTRTIKVFNTFAVILLLLSKYRKITFSAQTYKTLPSRLIKNNYTIPIAIMFIKRWIETKIFKNF